MRAGRCALLIALSPMVAGADAPDLGYGSLLVRLALGVGVVCLIAWIALKYGLKRLLPDQVGGAGMRVIARLPLEPRRSLLVAEVAGRYLVLAMSEAGCALVTELSEVEAASLEAHKVSRESFSARLATIGRGGDADRGGEER